MRSKFSPAPTAWMGTSDYRTKLVTASASSVAVFESGRQDMFQPTRLTRTIPFAVLPIPIDIRRQYKNDRLLQVVSTDFSVDDIFRVAIISIEFCDGSADEWELPERFDFQTYLEWHGWKLSYRGCVEE
jgi:hypothetical protein